MDEAWGTGSTSRTNVGVDAIAAPLVSGGGAPATEALVESVVDMVNHKQVYQLLDVQSQVYKSLKASQESLTAFNDFSATLYRNTYRDFERRTKMIKDMQKDLEYIYRKLKVLKSKVEEVTGVPPEVVRATLLEMDRAKAAFLGEPLEEDEHKEEKQTEANEAEVQPQTNVEEEGQTSTAENAGQSDSEPPSASQEEPSQSEESDAVVDTTKGA